MLGKGAFGKVNLGMHKLTDSLVAIKSINKEYLEEERSRRKVAKEVAILKKINHKNRNLLNNLPKKRINFYGFLLNLTIIKSVAKKND